MLCVCPSETVDEFDRTISIETKDTAEFCRSWSSPSPMLMKRGETRVGEGIMHRWTLVILLGELGRKWGISFYLIRVVDGIRMYGLV